MNERAESRYNTWEWRELAAIAKRRAGMRCEACGSDGPLDAHHIRPVREGGAFWDLANLRALCRKCHQAQHPGWVDEGLDLWMAEGERMYAERMSRESQDSEAKSRQRRANAPVRPRASPYASPYPGFRMRRVVYGLAILVGLTVLIANLFTCVVALTN